MNCLIALFQFIMQLSVCIGIEIVFFLKELVFVNNNNIFTFYILVMD
jgi:hypothetical protein